MFLRLEWSLNSNKICSEVEELNEVKFKFFFGLSGRNVIEQMIFLHESTSHAKKLGRIKIFPAQSLSENFYRKFRDDFNFFPKFTIAAA